MLRGSSPVPVPVRRIAAPRRRRRSRRHHRPGAAFLSSGAVTTGAPSITSTGKLISCTCATSCASTPASRRARRPGAGCPAAGAGGRRIPRCTGPPGRRPRGCARTSGPPRWCPRAESPGDQLYSPVGPANAAGRSGPGRGEHHRGLVPGERLVCFRRIGGDHVDSGRDLPHDRPVIRHGSTSCGHASSILADCYLSRSGSNLGRAFPARSRGRDGYGLRICHHVTRRAGRASSSPAAHILAWPGRIHIRPAGSPRPFGGRAGRT